MTDHDVSRAILMKTDEFGGMIGITIDRFADMLGSDVKQLNLNMASLSAGGFIRIDWGYPDFVILTLLPFGVVALKAIKEESVWEKSKAHLKESEASFTMLIENAFRVMWHCIVK